MIIHKKFGKCIDVFYSITKNASDKFPSSGKGDLSAIDIDRKHLSAVNNTIKLINGLILPEANDLPDDIAEQAIEIIDERDFSPSEEKYIVSQIRNKKLKQKIVEFLVQFKPEKNQWASSVIHEQAPINRLSPSGDSFNRRELDLSYQPSSKDMEMRDVLPGKFDPSVKPGMCYVRIIMKYLPQTDSLPFEEAKHETSKKNHMANGSVYESSYRIMPKESFEKMSDMFKRTGTISSDELDKFWFKTNSDNIKTGVVVAIRFSEQGPDLKAGEIETITRDPAKRYSEMVTETVGPSFKPMEGERSVVDRKSKSKEIVQVDMSSFTSMMDELARIHEERQFFKRDPDLFLKERPRLSKEEYAIRNRLMQLTGGNQKIVDSIITAARTGNKEAIANFDSMYSTRYSRMNPGKPVTMTQEKEPSEHDVIKDKLQKLRARRGLANS